MTFLLCVAFFFLSHAVVLVFGLCQGEVANRSVFVSHRFKCEQPSLQCLVFLKTTKPLNFYAAQELCQRINGTVIELRDPAASRCFENAKQIIAARSPFWINIVEVDTPRCEGICPNFIDLRWASSLPVDVCLLRSKFARSCTRQTSPSKFSCSQMGCCEVITDLNPPTCLLPTGPATGKLEYHNFAAEDNFAKIHGRRCGFIDASECPTKGRENEWHLKLCDGSNAVHEGCQPSEQIRVACGFPKPPPAPSEYILRSKMNKEKRQRQETKIYSDFAIFWLAIGSIISASFMISFQLIVGCRLRRQIASIRRSISKHLHQNAHESSISSNLEIINPNYEARHWVEKGE